MIAIRSSGYRAIRPTSCVRSPAGGGGAPPAAGACASAAADNRIAMAAAIRADHAADTRRRARLIRLVFIPLSIPWMRCDRLLDRVTAALEARGTCLRE